MTGSATPPERGAQPGEVGPPPADAGAPPADARWPPAAIPFAVWAVLLGASAGLQAGFGGHLLPVLLQAGAAAVGGMIAVGILLAARVQRRTAAGRRVIPELSLATVLVAVSIAAMVTGASIGGWLIIGGGLGLAAGTWGMVREYRAQRRAWSAAPPAAGEQDRTPGAVP